MYWQPAWDGVWVGKDARDARATQQGLSPPLMVFWPLCSILGCTQVHSKLSHLHKSCGGAACSCRCSETRCCAAMLCSCKGHQIGHPLDNEAVVSV